MVYGPGAIVNVAAPLVHELNTIYIGFDAAANGGNGANSASHANSTSSAHRFNSANGIMHVDMYQSRKLQEQHEEGFRSVIHHIRLSSGRLPS